MTHSKCIRILVLALLPLVNAVAHELQGNRATLVLRDATHVAMTLYLGYPELLHLTLAPQQDFSEFVLLYSGLPPDTFKTALLKAHAALQSQITVNNADGRPARLEHWVWPDASQAQEAMRLRAMRSLVAPNSHSHESPLEVRCEVQTSKPIGALSVVFAPEFQRVLVVSYQPKQVWAETGGKATEIKF